MANILEYGTPKRLKDVKDEFDSGKYYIINYKSNRLAKVSRKSPVFKALYEEGLVNLDTPVYGEEEGKVTLQVHKASKAMEAKEKKRKQDIFVRLYEPGVDDTMSDTSE